MPMTGNPLRLKLTACTLSQLLALLIYAGLSLEPLIGAISAGNAIVLKPSEQAPSSAAFLANTIPKYLDKKSVKVVQGGSRIGEKMLEHKWDKIFFTGNN